MKVTINLPKAKQIAHDKRRAMREEEFTPLDAIIAKQIPGKSATDAEAARQVVRDKYDKMQQAIDAATTPERLKTALGIEP
jgi:hypothetical protein